MYFGIADLVYINFNKWTFAVVSVIIVPKVFWSAVPAKVCLLTLNFSPNSLKVHSRYHI